jgi:hypothetical protein
MKRDPLSDMLVLYEGPPSDDAFLRQQEDEVSLVPDEETADAASVREIDHARARQLILDQSQRLLPPDEANALADHLLACDKCFRFAQDVAHQERQSGKHQAIQGGGRRD